MQQIPLNLFFFTSMNQWIIHGILLYATSLILVPAATQKKIANNKLSSADTKTKYANNCAKFSC